MTFRKCFEIKFVIPLCVQEVVTYFILPLIFQLSNSLHVKQGVLADYNMLVDKLNTDKKGAEVEVVWIGVKRLYLD